MAQIRIDDEVYERLKRSAEIDSRSVGQQIDYLLKNRLLLEDIADKLQGTTAGSEKKSLNPAGSESRLKKIRTPADIDAEIAALDAEELEWMETCQDPETASEVHAEYEGKRIVLREEKDEWFKNIRIQYQGRM